MFREGLSYSRLGQSPSILTYSIRASCGVKGCLRWIHSFLLYLTKVHREAAGVSHSLLFWETENWVPRLQDFQANGRDSIFTNECALDLCTSIQEFGQRGSLTPSEPCFFLRGLHSCQELCKAQGDCFYLSIFSKVSFSSIPRNATVKSSVGFSGLFQKSYLLRAAYGCEHLFLSLADFLKLH